MYSFSMSTQTFKQWIDSVKPVAPWILIVAIVLQCAFSPIAQFVLFPSGVLHAIKNITGGVLHQTFLAYVILALFMGFFLCYLGGLRTKDFALFRLKLLPALGYMLVAWMLIQISPLLLGYGLEIQASWSEDSIFLRRFSRFFFGQLIGNALYEELFYRAFLISQFTLLFRKKCSLIIAILLAILCSQLIFAVLHIPVRIVGGVPMELMVANIASTFMIGLIFVCIFLLTKNILATAGLHALWNASPNLFEHSSGSFGTKGLVIILVIILVCKCGYKRMRGTEVID